MQLGIHIFIQEFDADARYKQLVGDGGICAQRGQHSGYKHHRTDVKSLEGPDFMFAELQVKQTWQNYANNEADRGAQDADDFVEFREKYGKSNKECIDKNASDETWRIFESL